ncbi:DNA helicase INO80 isoform X2 [Cynara cardunculus var. scolymus]|uniref:DNA helicase INO80 isoform X2 n=1 Tax=Cynara cardunculus var. scolymus TaxID=59895 RepID=UPI000D62C7D0|nr:DNA helicase INO80 isoform X2 [Cynara cardunculus var. scolymus]XP_024964127.1 DNA helicase INO80 isoform X2 [Cynara cardunculus var. scolymus]
MESDRNLRNSYNYSNLFNLESLTKFQLPHGDEFDYYANSSQGESRGGPMTDRSNGMMSEKRKRRNMYSSDEDQDDISDTYFSEEQYRAMLGEHVHKYKRRHKSNNLPTSASNRNGTSGMKNSLGSKDHKIVNGRSGGARKIETIPQNLGHYKEADFAPEYGMDRSVCEPAYLDIGDGITYKIPPTYEMLATSLNLPRTSEIRVEEFYLTGTLDLGSLASMMSADKRLGPRSGPGMGEPKPQYESLWARLSSPTLNNSPQKFSLKVSDDALDSYSAPEGAAGGFRRSIMSESGVLQVFYVKVLEKGDTYEIIERSLPKKQKEKKDPSMVEKEEMDKVDKYWVNMVRKDIPKHHRFFINFHRKQLTDAKRFSENCQREVKMKVSRSLKLMRGASIRTRKLARDMLVFWKRVDKEMAEVRKREEKEAAEALKREQELREAKRQQQRLNFLLSQTELYGHFMQNKPSSQPPGILVEKDKGDDQEAIMSSSEVGAEEDPEEAEMKMEALKAAQDAVSKQKMITSAFDDECSRLRQASAAEDPEQAVAGSSNIDLLHPSTMPVASSVQTPELFKGSLKEYQLKGLQWLVNCYEQGLNGILADEMGLGKTIQAMAFLAHLAEEKNIWGPFLVVAPTSVLNNWADEIGRFCPDLKTLPYWGGIQERTILRKNINPKRLYRRDAGFHILITSYQLLVSDEKYFRRVKWQYMVLDEAQAIKSSTSIRWKTLLSFNCRNRLLLTGTPVQNNMAELWALLHFIMPTLFDSHEQFNEWFSKGIENHAEHGGTLNEHQLSRLHAILKPFMLRRVKKDVVSELTGKTEITVHCKLSSRQQAFYQAIKNKISLAELFDSNRGQLNEKKFMNLMNIVIQLRKVCNHPELFERNEGSSYFYFGDIPNPLLPPPFGELEDVYYSGSKNPITYKVPKLIYQEIVRSSDVLLSGGKHNIKREFLEKHFNIFSPVNIYQSIFKQDEHGPSTKDGTFGFTRLIDLSPAEAGFIANSSLMERLLFSIERWDWHFSDGVVDFIMESEDKDIEYNHLGKEKVRAVTKMLLMPSKSETNVLRRRLATGPGDAPFEALVLSHQDRLASNVRLLHSAFSFIPQIRAPPIDTDCPDRDFAYRKVEELHHPWIKRLLVGFGRTSDCNGPKKPDGAPHHLIQEIDNELPVLQPALQLTHKIFGSCPPMQSFDPAKMLTDSGKLQTLDILLKRLRAGNHRVLLFAQMTKMLNIIEDYMNYRKYRYLRLDGSSTIMDRRDMVKDFQHRSDIFVFLLSTRAGGVGINLTAADTVIFYESDWNPTLDLQAMDRAHRLGQTKDVTVYRLICKETVEEKILHRASQKSTVQQLVMTGGHIQGDILAPEDVISLLIDDAQMEQKLKEIPAQVKDRQKRKGGTKAIRIDAEGDARLEDLMNPESPADVYTSSPAEKPVSSKKRKTSSEKGTPKPRPQKAPKKLDSLASNTIVSGSESDDRLPHANMHQQTPQRTKRPTKSINENLEPVFSAPVVMAEHE